MIDTYPSLMTQAAQNWFRVDGVDKRSKERQIIKSFRNSRSLPGLIGDAFKLARVFR